MKKQNKRHILIGQTQTSLIKEDQKLLAIDYSAIKANHFGIFGKSWSWKTWALTSVLFGTIKESIITYYDDLSIQPDTFLVLDPHNSNIPPLLSLLKDFYTKNPEYSRTSHIQKFVKEILNSESDETSVYRGHYMEKALIFNPLASKRLMNDISYLNKATNLNMSALKSIFDFSSFGPRNSEAIEWILKTFLFINSYILRETPSYTLLSYKDIYKLFDELKKTGKLPNWITTHLKTIYGSANKDTKEIIDSINSSLKSLSSNLLWNKEYYDTTITKFKDFTWDLWDTFWYCQSYSDLTLDLEDVYWEHNIETRCFFLDLSAFSNIERKVIIAFFYNGSYFLWSLKNHQNPTLWTHWVICDEFQSFLELKGSKNYLIDLLEKWTNELRKYNTFYWIVLQSVPVELKDLLNNLWFIFVFSLPPEQAEMFTDILSYWINKDFAEITEKNISNLKRWEFFASFDTIEYWLLTVISKSLDINNPKIREMLIN
ncbi:MAG: hypothetical protein ACD_71C00114G0015 [uncultured bacterium (gcode 4)]|uniref:Uncharacterized protein n=1 Tax=uncultured bacterium (gcode 4) TaxID=1234023 RepID=K1Z4R1_9BACT|nr:MAG: hypothetical protein ACD_71C00114G0015 [uncultured bacterium (gcode 4)]